MPKKKLLYLDKALPTQIYIGFDTGHKNLAMTFLHFDGEKPIIIRSIMIEAFLPGLKDLDIIPIVEKLKAEFVDLLMQYGASTYVTLLAERFMPRGRFDGHIGEISNIHLGILISVCHELGISVKLITSALWKNAVNKNKTFDMKAFYKAVTVRKQPGMPKVSHIHKMDSCLMAFFLANKLDCFTSRKRFARITSDVIRGYTELKGTK